MSYESRAYDELNDDGFGPDPVVVLVVKGTHDVSRLVSLLNGGQPVVEQLALGTRITNQVRRDRGGRAALELLAEHGGPDFSVPPIPGLGEECLEVLHGLAAGKTATQIGRELNITRNAVSMRTMRACKAAGVRTREQLLALCVARGLVKAVAQ